MKNYIKSLLFAFAMVVSIGIFAIDVNAASGTVSVESANVREGAGKSYKVVSGVMYGDTITIDSSVNGSDGEKWYKITLSDGTKGYILASLVKSSDAPAVSTPADTTPEKIDTSKVTEAGVTKVVPVSATVSGSSSSIRIRSDATTDSDKVTTVKSADVLTVQGTKEGADGKTWYLVSFIVDSSEVTGYIRSDFVNLSGEIQEYVPEPDPTPVPDEPVVSEPAPTPVPVTKDYDTVLIDSEWYLVNNETGEGLVIVDTLNYVKECEDNVTGLTKKVGRLKVVIAIFVILTLISAAAAVFFFIKANDDSDEYVKGIDRDARRRNMSQSGRPADPSSDRRVQRPAGTRPAAPGTRPAAPGTRPAVPGTRPAGTAPAARPDGQRPASRPVTNQRPMQGQNPKQAPGTRPAGAAPAARPAAPTAPVARPAAPKPQPTKDDFDLDFLDDNGGKR